MTKRTADGNVQQRVFDAITKGGKATLAEIRAATKLTDKAIRQAIRAINRAGRVIEQCKQGTIYQLSPEARRPTDGRGSKG